MWPSCSQATWIAPDTCGRPQLSVTPHLGRKEKLIDRLLSLPARILAGCRAEIDCTRAARDSTRVYVR
jgi:hypothetical protein